MSLLGGDFFLPNTEKLCLVEIQNYVVKVFYAIHVPVDMDWLPYRWAWSRLYLQQEQSFSVRALARVLFILHFQFNHFIFLFEKTNKIAITISFLLYRVFFSGFAD